MVTLMTLFSRTYSNYISVNDVLTTNRRLTMFRWASNYSMYIVNIMTNQGNVAYIRRKILKYNDLPDNFVLLVDLLNTLRKCNF